MTRPPSPQEGTLLEVGQSLEDGVRLVVGPKRAPPLEGPLEGAADRPVDGGAARARAVSGAARGGAEAGEGKGRDPAGAQGWSRGTAELSGGQKALVGLALTFALAARRRLPLYVLDEVS